MNKSNNRNLFVLPALLSFILVACSDDKPKIKFVEPEKEEITEIHEESTEKEEHREESEEKDEHAMAEATAEPEAEVKHEATEAKPEPVAEVKREEEEAKHVTHWSYTGAGAPHAWGKLKDEYGTCGSGKSQSPIDISSVTVSNLSPVEVDYKSTKVHVLNNGHTIKVAYDEGSSIKVNGKQYKLLQFHFHSPSEHTIGGKAYDMVAHLVHQAEDGQLGVVGILMKKGEENPFLNQFWKYLPENTDGTFEDNSASINVLGFLPPDMTYFNYSGSLTTPPCSEGVNWMVLSTPVEVSAEQIAQFTELFPHSVRPVQPLNGRVVRLSN